MDRELLGLSLSYHGSYLLDRMRAEEQLAVEDVITLKSNVPIPVSDEPEDVFDCRLLNFIAKKADLLFCKDDNLSTRENHVDNRRARYCAVLPPLEYFMEVSRTARREQLFRNLTRGNIVVGWISALHETGFTITLLALDVDMARDIADLKLSAFCPTREIPKGHAHENPLEAYSIKDKVRAIVVGVNDEKITVSLQRRTLGPHQDISLGSITEEELPPYYRAIETANRRPYGTMLREAPEFRNPLNVSNMAAGFGLGEIDRQPSLMRGLFRVQYKDSEYADKLRKEQSYRLAMRSVADGVDHFKNGRTVEAMQMFNKALQVDTENVEALVARGALYANSEGYRRALEDFDAALEINPNHMNARKYACDTLLALSRSFLETGDTDSAISRVYRASLLQPNNPETTSLLAEIQRRMLSAETSAPPPSSTAEDTSTVLHAKELLKNSLRRDDRKKRKSSTMSWTHQRSRSSSSDSFSSEPRTKKTRRKENGSSEDGASDSDSIVELTWVPRNPEPGHNEGYSELIGCTTSDVRRGYDMSLVNPERRQSDGGRQEAYGPAVPPPQSVKVGENDIAAGKDISENTNCNAKKRKRSTSSSSSTSSNSSSESSSSSGSSENCEGSRKQKKPLSSSPEKSAARHRSINASSRVLSRRQSEGERQRESITSRRESGVERRRESNTSRRESGGERRRESIGSARRTSGTKERRQLSRSSSSNGSRNATPERRASRNRGDENLSNQKTRRYTSASHSDTRRRTTTHENRSFTANRRSSYDPKATKTLGNAEKGRSESGQSSTSDLGRCRSNASEENSISMSSKMQTPKSSDITAVKQGSVVDTAAEKTSDKSKETLEDMEAFLRHLKAQAKAKAAK